VSEHLVGKYITLSPPSGRNQAVYLVTKYSKDAQLIGVRDINSPKFNSHEQHFYPYVVDKVMPGPPVHIIGEELAAHVLGEIKQGFVREIYYWDGEYNYLLETITNDYFYAPESNLAIPCRSVFETRARTWSSSGVYGTDE
jgi:hypothetical protein